MLFTFPARALDCNWLNTKIIQTLLDGMNAVDAGTDPEDWPECLPADKRDVLRRRTGLRPKLSNFWDTYQGLTAEDKMTVRGAIERQTRLPEVFSDAAPCPSADDLPDAAKLRGRQLADYLFGQLSEIKEGEKCIRDVQFEVIHTSGIRTCPFCGLYYFRPPGTRRNALDHLLPISKYPFAGADLRNLPPVCHECNSMYKRDVDILLDRGGHRRCCSDPYDGPTFAVSLDGSEFGAGNAIRGIRMPRWEIGLLGAAAPQAETWDAVYQIKSRYTATLDADFLSWIEQFALWFVREFGRGRNSDEVAVELPRYIDNVLLGGFEDRAFLKAEAFRVMDRHCRDPAIAIEAKEWLWNFVAFAT